LPSQFKLVVLVIDDKLQKGLQMIVHQLKHLEGITKMGFVYTKLDFLEFALLPFTTLTLAINYF
jgi:hypothetical protein